MAVDCLCAFPSPIITFDLPYYHKFRDSLIEHIYDVRAQTQTVLRSNNGGWQSPPVSLPNTFANHIFANLNEIVTTQFLASDWICEIGNLWYNINPSGACNDRHTHPGCDLACVFYVKIPDGDCGQLELENPNHFTQFHMLNTMDESIKDTTKISHSLWFPPEEGVTVVFPANLLHRVMTNNTNHDRISISWNMRIVKDG